MAQMPHYHAEEATRYLKPVLGKYYTHDDREVSIMPLLPSFPYVAFLSDSLIDCFACGKGFSGRVALGL